MSPKLPGALCEAKIGNFDGPLGEENVSYLEISMDDILVGQVFEALEYFVNGFAGLPLGHGTLTLNPGFEVSVAEFGDNVAIVGTGKNLIAAQNVGVIERLHDIDFRVEEVHEGWSLDATQLHYFNSHGLVCVVSSLLVISFRPLYTLLKLPFPSTSFSLNV